MSDTPRPLLNPIYNKNGLMVSMFETKEGLHMEFKFDTNEARGHILLDESAYGLDISCPEVHEERLALLDVFYTSPSAIDAELDGAPLQIVFDSPEQTEDPVGRVRFFPKGTRVDFEHGVQELKTGHSLTEKEFGYPANW